MRLKRFPMEVVSTTGLCVFKLKDFDCTITETAKMNEEEIYPLSTKEVLNVLHMEGVLDKVTDLFIFNIRQPHVQGYVEGVQKRGEKWKFNGRLRLKTPEKKTNGSRIRKEFLVSKRLHTLWVLLHEIGHIKGHDKEDDADAYANEHVYDYWKKVIKE